MRAFYLFLIFSISFISYGQKYYTLASGNWNNTTSVWSLNGLTPCGCFPTNTLISDTVIVNHPINLTANLSASASSKIDVSPTGSLSNSLFDLVISNSITLSNGSINIRSLRVNVGGIFEIYNSSLIISLNVDIYGLFKSSFSNITVISGNIEIFSTGSFILSDGSYITFQTGNFKNSGLTSICSSCCLNISSGNVTNEASGTFTGGGSVIVDAGNIKNYGIWDPALRWCASGSSVGMVSPENCILANQLCALVPLPTELIYFDGFHDENQNVLLWETASELNSDYYLLGKSSDGENWLTLGSVDAAPTTSYVSQYSYSDYDVNEGINYYKLIQINSDGVANFTEILGILNNSNTDLLIYPNPVNEVATIQLKQNHRFKILRLVDALGRQIKEIEIGDAFTIEIQLPPQDGVYFIHAEGENSSKMYKFIKI